tara:strand:+ start:319 stop:660 length:342 start_codon:yes stop_codon:yes gene_type:complete
MTNKFIKKRDKIRAQMKSRFYYMFWGAATVAVVSGQLYVGTSYRAMARSMNRWFEETIDLIQMPQKRRIGKQEQDGYYMPIPTPEDYERQDDNGVQFLKDLDPDDYILWETVE